MNPTFLRLVLLFFLLPLSLPLRAEISSLSEAINKAGRQRMLSQRMLKDYSMIGLGVNQRYAQGQLDDAIRLFDEQLAELEEYAPNSSIRKALEEVVTLWKPYRAVIKKKPDRSKALDLLRQSADLLRATHKVVMMLEDLSTTPAGRLVNMAGRQRMLSQKISMLYMYQVWGLDNASIRSEMRQAVNEFKGALSELSNETTNTDALKQKLRRARTEWKLFKHGLDGKEGKPIPYIVNLTGDKLLNTMNEITALYAQLESK